jgi:DNA polymerase III subunit beta
MDLEVVEGVAVQTTGSGATTVPAHTLYDIVRKLPDGAEVTFDSGGDDEKLVMRCGRSRFTLPCLPVADFPVMSGADLAISSGCRRTRCAA